jgi:transcriptional regulator with XRE-family HTH domain
MDQGGGSSPRTNSAGSASKRPDADGFRQAAWRSQAAVSNWESGKVAPREAQRATIEQVIGPLGSTPDPDMGPSLIGRQLTTLRTQTGLTPAELAQKADVSVPAVYNIESGRVRFPRASTLRKLEAALGKKFSEEVQEEVREASQVEGLGDFEDFDPHDEDDWPEGGGIYVFYDISERPIYVGQSGNVKKRLRSHEPMFWFKTPIVYTASYIRIEDEILRRQTESVLIKFLKSNAVLNKQNVERD